MELFKRRPLCVCCGLFLLFSYLCVHLGFSEKLLLTFISIAIVLLLIVAVLIFKIKKYSFISLIMCFVFIAVAFINNFLRIDMQHKSAQEYIGDRSAVMDIVQNEHYSEYSASYIVDIKNIDGEKTSIRAILVFGFGAERLLVGDTLYADVELCEMDARILGQTGYQRTDREDVSLIAALYESNGVMVKRFDRSAGFFDKLFAQNGISVLLDDLRINVSERLDKCLGEDVGAMANAYLTGDRSELSISTARDYRRAGISHLFAVSGMHVTILLGAIELLLKKFYCRKTVRCAVLTVCALGLLCLTGFSMSAMRSVFMLFMVYVAFLISEENDSPTSLFLSVAIIILITPYAIYELGMWMSFFATLGVITVYPIVHNAMPNNKKKSRFSRVLFALSRSCVLSIIGTVSATMFLLPISWAIFGEMSVVSVPANIVMSPLSTVFLIMSALATLFCNVPILNFVIRYASLGLSALMNFFVGDFSGLDIATVSLRYPFAKWIVIIFSVILVVMLVIRVSRKILFVIPPITFAVSFFIGVLCFNAINPTALSYNGNGHREIISITNDQSLAIVDMSDGRYARFYEAYQDASAYGATQVDSIVLTSISSAHVSSLDYFLRNNVVHTLYIPEPYSEDSRELLIELTVIAESCGVKVNVYDGQSAIEICDDTYAKVICSSNGEKRSVAAFFAKGDKLCAYVDAFVYRSERETECTELLKRCDTVIIGNNGVPDEKYWYDIPDNAKILYCSESLMKKSEIESEADRTYFNTHKSVDFQIVMD